MSIDGLPSPLAGMQRDINCLSDPDRNTRKRGLESIKKALLGGKQLSEDIASSCLELLHRPLMKLMDDAVEKNRELALQLLHGLLLLAPRADYVFAFLTACKGRVGQVGDVVEPSEELRLQLVQALDAVVRSSMYPTYHPSLMSLPFRSLDVCLSEISFRALMLLCTCSSVLYATHSTRSAASPAASPATLPESTRHLPPLTPRRC